MRLYQYDKGYRYNSDTIMLYGFVSDISCKGHILDIGAGCGILGLLLKRDFPQCELTQIDIQKENVYLCKKNANENALKSRVIEGDFLESFEGERFDLIVSNPPFYHKDVQKSVNEHLAISRYNDYLPLKSMIKQSNRLLTPHGRLLFCYDAKQLPQIIQILSEYKLTVVRIQLVHAKKEKDASLVCIEAKKSSKSLCKILPPLIVHEEDGYSESAQALFDKACTTSITCPIS